MGFVCSLLIKLKSVLSTIESNMLFSIDFFFMILIIISFCNVLHNYDSVSLHSGWT